MPTDLSAPADYDPASKYPGADWHAETVGTRPGTMNHNSAGMLLSEGTIQGPGGWAPTR